MTNVLMVYPKYPDTFWSFKHVLKFISKKAAFPPLGLLTVAAMLPKKWHKKLIDVNVNELKDEDIVWADMVFISAMIVQDKSAQEIIDRCKTKGKVVVCGGPTFTSQYRKFIGVDHFILNEAEITLPPFLEDLEKGCAKHIYTTDKRPDINQTPKPLWSLISSKDYATMLVQYSRGCPFNCEFCDIIILNGRIPRTKGSKQIISEFQSLYNYGWRGSVFIVDDNFIGNKVNVKSMLPHLIKWQKKLKFPFKFLTEASTNLADDEELMKLMNKANFNKVFVGLETPSVDSLNECGKTQNVKRDLADVVRIIHQHGIQVMGGFIVGFDNDSENIFKTQIKFIQKIGVVTAMVGILNAIPQTRLWHRLRAEGRLLNSTSGENTDGSINFIPKMKKKMLIKGYKNILSTIYAPKFYYQRIDNFVKSLKPSIKSKISMLEFIAFLKSVWRIGILSESRKYYWKLLIKTLFTKKAALPAVVEQAIYGLHFSKITRKIVSTRQVES